MRIFIYSADHDTDAVTLKGIDTIEAAADYILSKKWIKADNGKVIFVNNICRIRAAG